MEKEAVKEDQPKGVFSNTIFKTLRTNFGARDIPAVSLAEVLFRILRA